MKKYSIAIAALLVIGISMLFFSYQVKTSPLSHGSRDALVPSKFKPIAFIENDRNGLTVKEDEAALREKIELFKNDTSFAYTSMLIQQALKLGLSEGSIRTELKQQTSHLGSSSFKFDLNRLYKIGDSVYLPYDIDPDSLPFVFRYELGSNNDGANRNEGSFLINNVRVYIESVFEESKEAGVRKIVVKDGRRSIIYLNDQAFKPVLRDENIKLITEAVSGNYDNLAGMPFAEIPLKGPIDAGGRTWSRVLLKGVVFNRDKDVSGQASGLSSSNILKLKVDDVGRVIGSKAPSLSRGRMLFVNAKKEFRNAYYMYNNDYLKRRNIFVPAPLGYGVFSDMPTYKGKRQGFVIFALDRGMPKLGGPQSRDIAIYARALRALHDAGFVFPGFYFGNYLTNADKIYLCDLEEAEYLDTNSVSPKKILMAQLLDIFHFYMKNVYNRLTSIRNWRAAIMQIGSSKESVQERAAREDLGRFMRSYFHDCNEQLCQYLTAAIIPPFEMIAFRVYKRGELSMSYDSCEDLATPIFKLLRYYLFNRIIEPADARFGGKSHIQVKAERDTADRFLDTIKICANQAEKEKKLIVIGMDTSWIPGEQGAFIQPLISAISRLSVEGGLPNIRILRGKGGELASDILSLSTKARARPLQVIVIANQSTFLNDIVATLKDPKDEKVSDSLLVVAVNPKDITTNSYIRILDMLTIALKIAFHDSFSAHHPFINVVQDPDNPRIYHYIPRAEPVGEPDELKKIYHVQVMALQSM